MTTNLSRVRPRNPDPGTYGRSQRRDGPGLLKVTPATTDIHCLAPNRAAGCVEVMIVMKSFARGDVVPGCTATWLCSTEDEVLAAVAVHAEDHGIVEVPAELVDQVRSKIRIVA